MYEDPVPASQPAPPQAQIITSHPSTAVTNVHFDVTLSSQPAGSQGGHASLPVPGYVPVANPSSSAGSTPISVKFITVSGSQVLHSSGPLPPGNLKLIPMQPATAAKSPLPSDSTSKHLVVRVQGVPSESDSKPGGGLVLMKEHVSASNSKVTLETPEAAMPLVKHLDSSGDTMEAALDREPGVKSVGNVELRSRPSGSVATTQASEEPEGQADTKIGIVAAAASRGEDPAAALDSSEQCAAALSARSSVSVKPLTQVASAKHILPNCAAAAAAAGAGAGAGAPQKGIAVQVHPQSQVPVQSEPCRNVTAAPAVRAPECGGDRGDVSSAPLPGSEDVVPSASTESSTTHHQPASSASDSEGAAVEVESAVGDSVVKQEVKGENVS